jgi:hypothetical protein
VLHPPLGELGAAAVGGEADDPQVAVGAGRVAVGGGAFHDRDLGGHGQRVPVELGVAGLVLAVQPAADDLVPAAPRLAVRLGVVGRVLGEQGADGGRVVGVPGPDVPLDPGPDPAGLLVLVHPLTLIQR